MINFIDNYSYQSGGGIFINGCDMNIICDNEKPESKSLFKNNTALMGGAMRFFNFNNSFLIDPITDNIQYILEDNKGLICINNFGSTATKYIFKNLDSNSRLKSGIASIFSFSLYD